MRLEISSVTGASQEHGRFLPPVYLSCKPFHHSSSTCLSFSSFLFSNVLCSPPFFSFCSFLPFVCSHTLHLSCKSFSFSPSLLSSHFLSLCILPSPFPTLSPSSPVSLFPSFFFCSFTTILSILFSLYFLFFSPHISFVWLILPPSVCLSGFLFKLCFHIITFSLLNSYWLLSHPLPPITSVL